MTTQGVRGHPYGLTWAGPLEDALSAGGVDHPALVAPVHGADHPVVAPAHAGRIGRGALGGAGDDVVAAVYLVNDAPCAQSTHVSRGSTTCIVCVTECIIWDRHATGGRGRAHSAGAYVLTLARCFRVRCERQRGAVRGELRGAAVPCAAGLRLVCLGALRWEWEGGQAVAPACPRHLRSIWLLSRQALIPGQPGPRRRCDPRPLLG